jgi:hypothetical protein
MFNLDHISELLNVDVLTRLADRVCRDTAQLTADKRWEATCLMTFPKLSVILGSDGSTTDRSTRTMSFVIRGRHFQFAHPAVFEPWTLAEFDPQTHELVGDPIPEDGTNSTELSLYAALHKLLQTPRAWEVAEAEPEPEDEPIATEVYQHVDALVQALMQQQHPELQVYRTLTLAGHITGTLVQYAELYILCTTGRVVQARIDNDLLQERDVYVSPLPKEVIRWLQIVAHAGEEEHI